MPFTPEQQSIADQLQFKMLMHMNMEDGGELQHVAEYKGMKVYRVVWTPKKHGKWGNGEQSFYIDREKKKYTDPVDLLNELIKRTLTVS